MQLQFHSHFFSPVKRPLDIDFPLGWCTADQFEIVIPSFLTNIFILNNKNYLPDSGKSSGCSNNSVVID